MLQLGSNSGTANQVFGLHESGSVFYNDGNQSASQNFDPSPTLGVWRRASGATKAETQFYRFGTPVFLTSPSTANSLALPSSASSLSLGNGNKGSGNDFFRGLIREAGYFPRHSTTTTLSVSKAILLINGVPLPTYPLTIYSKAHLLYLAEVRT